MEESDDSKTDVSVIRERIDETGKNIKTDACSEMGRRRLLGPPGTLNTITPCAACKLLRRKCAEECPFSPYFSPHEPHKFAAVHKVFGASNVSKMLMEVPESQRADAANSLVYEANLRLRDPVYGCMGAIVTLQQQMQTLQAELNAVRAEILKYKFREVTTTSSHTQAAVISAVGAVPIAAPSSPLPRTPPVPPRPLPSIVVSSSSSSSASNSLYTSSTTATGYSNVPYFD
ncbi:LOB domain-containing protein 15 [Hibiscus syriacus]|uniref:LOB domain-containing protein 15 n=1 Tax=Hibiscus syriacus TaxID=106335 RepID=A0A6A2Y4Q5_HIBSY|nr:LOB domain-containing protein 15-like [Hibiscus syriacus]KAE8667459.1 LOB domain-containing protein 15 [Hibiscus syriacus]